jgi:nitrate/nitrite transporter NarK
MFAIAIPARADASVTIALLLMGSGFFYAFYPAFWSMPTTILSASAAAATFGLINSVGQLAGFAAPYAIGVLNDRTHSLAAGFAVIACAYFAAAGLILTLKIRNPFDPID